MIGFYFRIRIAQHKIKKKKIKTQTQVNNEEKDMESKTMMTCDNNKLYISALLLILQIRRAFCMTGLFTIKHNIKGYFGRKLK